MSLRLAGFHQQYGNLESYDCKEAEAMLLLVWHTALTTLQMHVLCRHRLTCCGRVALAGMLQLDMVRATLLGSMKVCFSVRAGA